jgi:hypothetical protein
MHCTHLDPLGAHLFLISSSSGIESSLGFMLVIDDVSMLIMCSLVSGYAGHISYTHKQYEMNIKDIAKLL